MSKNPRIRPTLGKKNYFDKWLLKFNPFEDLHEEIYKKVCIPVIVYNIIIWTNNNNNKKKTP